MEQVTERHDLDKQTLGALRARCARAGGAAATAKGEAALIVTNETAINEMVRRRVA